MTANPRILINEDFMALEAPLKAHVEANVSRFDAQVLSFNDAIQRPERITRPLAVLIGFDTHRVAEQVGRGRHVRIIQRWNTVIQARALKEGDKLRADTGPLSSRVLTMLSGWTPDPQTFTPLELVTGRGAAYIPGTFSIPFAWETTATIKGEN